MQYCSDTTFSIFFRFGTSVRAISARQVDFFRRIQSGLDYAILENVGFKSILGVLCVT